VHDPESEELKDGLRRALDEIQKTPVGDAVKGMIAKARVLCPFCFLCLLLRSNPA